MRDLNDGCPSDCPLAAVRSSSEDEDEEEEEANEEVLSLASLSESTESTCMLSVCLDPDVLVTTTDGFSSLLLLLSLSSEDEDEEDEEEEEDARCAVAVRVLRALLRFGLPAVVRARNMAVDRTCKQKQVAVMDR